jgi:putative addiction module component (TIGR02574 family)
VVAGSNPVTPTLNQKPAQQCAGFFCSGKFRKLVTPKVIYMTLQTLKDEASKLSKLERLLFVQYVLDTISREVEEEESVLSDEWIAELDARQKSYKSGGARTYSWEEVKKDFPDA